MSNAAAFNFFFSSSTWTKGKLNVFPIVLREWLWLSKLLYLWAGYTLRDSFIYFVMVEYTLALFDRTIVFTKWYTKGDLVNLILLQTRNLEHEEDNWFLQGLADSWCQVWTTIPVLWLFLKYAHCQRRERSLTSGRPRREGPSPRLPFCRSHTFAWMLLSLMFHRSSLKNHYNMLHILHF